MGRTPLIIGQKDNHYCVTMETCAFPNLDYNLHSELGPGEIAKITPEGVERMAPPGKEMRICAFLP